MMLIASEAGTAGGTAVVEQRDLIHIKAREGFGGQGASGNPVGIGEGFDPDKSGVLRE